MNSLPIFIELIVAVDLLSSLVFRIQHAEHLDAKHLSILLHLPLIASYSISRCLSSAKTDGNKISKSGASSKRFIYLYLLYGLRSLVSDSLYFPPLFPVLITQNFLKNFNFSAKKPACITTSWLKENIGWKKSNDSGYNLTSRYVCSHKSN